MGQRKLRDQPRFIKGEQEALEQLAALSVLARWVDQCDVINTTEGALGA